MKKRAVLLILFISIVSAGCAKNTKPVKEETVQTVTAIPQTLIVESVISGRILGMELNKPYGLAKDFQGNVYMSDAGGNRIIKFDSTLKPLIEIGGFGSSEGLLNRPTFISFDKGLNLTVSDESNRRLSRYNSRMVFVEEILFSDEDDPLKFGYPSGVAVTPYGETWVSDRQNNRIAVFNNVGRFDYFVGEYGASSGQFDSPEKIIIDQNHDFIICDAGNGRLEFFDQSGNFKRVMSNKFFEYPVSVSIQDNLFWVLDGIKSRIYCLDRSGELLNMFPSMLPGLDDALNEPTDLIFIGDDRIVISDTGNSRLVVCRVIYEENQR